MSSLSEKLALSELVESRRGLTLGRSNIQIATLKNFPETSTPALMSHLATVNTPFCLVLSLLVLPQTEEKERLSRKQRLAQGMASGNRVRNLHAETQLDDIEQTMTAMISSGEKLVATSIHTISFGEGFEKVMDEAGRFGPGCQWFEETVGEYPVFFGILPFAPTFITRPKRILTRQLSDFLPLYGIGPGHKNAEVLFETHFQSVLGFSLFEKSPSANGILIGSTGSGKSTLACGLILGMAAGNSEQKPSAFVIDVGNSFKRSIEYLGGSSIDFSPESGTILNPFDLAPGQLIPDPEKVKFLSALFEEIMGDQGSLGKLEKALLEAEILDFYQSDLAKTFSSFRNYLGKSDQIELRRLSKLLSLWCNPHPYGLLFDGETNVKLDGEHLHLELKECQRHPDLLRAAMLVVMNSIWKEIKARFPKRAVIAIDECHTVIRPSGDGRANASARYVDDFFRQIRKFGGCCLAMSQAAKDLKTNEIGDGILANSPNRFILRQRGDEKTLREDLKLNDKEINDAFSLSQVKGVYSEFYLHSEYIKGVLIYRPTPLEYWLSTTHAPDNALLAEEKEKYPEFGLSQLMDHMATHFPNGAEGDAA